MVVEYGTPLNSFEGIVAIDTLPQSRSFIDLFEYDFLILFPEIFLCIGMLLLLIYGVLVQQDLTETGDKESHNSIELRENPRQKESSNLVFTSVTVESRKRMSEISRLAIMICLFTGILLVNSPIQHAVVFYNCLVLDTCTQMLKIGTLLAVTACLLASLYYWKQYPLAAFECVILLLCASLSMFLLVSSYDLITLYMAIELQSLSFYVLAASNKTSEFSTEAGLKYFLLGALSSGILLLGCSLIYGFTGITNFQEFSRLLIDFPEQYYGWTALSETGFFLGVLCVAVAFLFKITAAPFHMWAPDVYEGSPTAITAFFSIVPKIALLGVAIRLFHSSFYDIMPTWQTVFLISSLTSMIIGSLAAMRQTKIKRLLAYSSISHVGYMLMGFSCGTIEGIQAVLFYLVIYIIMSVHSFSFLLGLQQAGPASTVRMTRVKYITDLRTLSRTHPILAVTLTILLFSLAGIPPLAGFCAKFYVFFTALSSHLYLLALVGVLTSVISCFYYIRIIRNMYFDTQNAYTVWPIWLSIPPENAWLLANTSLWLLLFFVNPSTLLLASHQMALAVCV